MTGTKKVYTMLSLVVSTALKEFTPNSQFEFLEYTPQSTTPADLMVIDKDLMEKAPDGDNVITISSVKPADLIKPIRIASLLSIMHSKLNVIEYTKPIHIAHNVSLLKSSGTIQGRNNQTIILTDKELSLLVFIMENPASSKEDILKNVWGFAADVETFTLETHTSSLRRKLEDASESRITITVSSGRYSLYS